MVADRIVEDGGQVAAAEDGVDGFAQAVAGLGERLGCELFLAAGEVEVERARSAAASKKRCREPVRGAMLRR
ncbi:hypothetical protein [Nocardia sp. NBC_01009]|uniref:hypothetical protein n=1 Tax=Nocardia sp. NBC_01009 TaxID=2975996 RepID=UPI00386F300C|nr:hypothetical protein OHA42_10750 [Nocardia sp. NBC_01009]